MLRRLQHLGLHPADRCAPAAAARAGAAVARVRRRELGDGFWIVEEGLNGRTPVWDDPLERFRIGRLGQFAEEFAGAVERSRDLARHYAAVADARSCPWIDAGAHVGSSDHDGIHLDAPSHERLGVVVAHHVRRLLA